MRKVKQNSAMYCNSGFHKLLLGIALFVFRNERLVGEAIKMSGLQRSDVFVVTKLHWDDHSYERCKVAFKESLKKVLYTIIFLYELYMLGF